MDLPKISNCNLTLILGNGFDLDLGLKSSYRDFINSKEFKEIVNTNAFARYLANKTNLNNWIDIEIELSNYSVELSDFKESDYVIKPTRQTENRVFYHNYAQLKDQLAKYIVNLKPNKNLDSISRKVTSLLSGCKNLDVLDFNYTNSFFNINKDKLESKNITIRSIHGEAEKNNIVMGVEDNAKINKEHAFLNKATDIMMPIYNISPFKLRYFENIIIFGHSMGRTDHSYFYECFEDILKNNEYSPRILFINRGTDGINNLKKELWVLSKGNMSKLFGYVYIIDTLTDPDPVKSVMDFITD